MGRYDKIKYWDGSSWRQPNRIEVWNGSSWIDYGTNDSGNTNDIKVWNGSTWVRETLDRTTNYGDKEWYCNGSNATGILGGTAYNLNENVFDFYCYCTKTANNTKTVAFFGDKDDGWAIDWMSDGRLRWETRYKGGSWVTYSDNAVTANNWATIDIHFNSGRGEGTLYFNGVKTFLNRVGRHEYSTLRCVIGDEGMKYRNKIRVHGVKYGGSVLDTTAYINHFSNQSSGEQTVDNLTIRGSSVIQQDSWVTWT